MVAAAGPTFVVEGFDSAVAGHRRPRRVQRLQNAPSSEQCDLLVAELADEAHQSFDSAPSVLAVQQIQSVCKKDYYRIIKSYRISFNAKTLNDPSKTIT